MFGRKGKKREKQAEVDLNRVVTPMLDMTFQILFFLIMNFRLPTPEGQVDLQLPDDPTGSPTQQPVLDTADDEYRVRLLITGQQGENQGLLGGMTWKPKSLQQAEAINSITPPNDEQNDFARNLDPLLYGFFRKLKEVQPKEGGTQPTIKIESDGRLRYSELLRVMDVARKMKFTNVGVMITQKGREREKE